MENLDNITITKDSPVEDAAVYLGGVTDLLDITDKLAWHEVDAGSEYWSEKLTLGEISRQVAAQAKGRHAIITVFQQSALEGEIYQYGNYKNCGWVKHGSTKGYA